MYNRYIPPDLEYHPAPPNDAPSPGGETAANWWKSLRWGGGNLPWRDLLGGEGGDPLDSLLKSLKLDGVDSGDILLVLLILFLLIEGDDQWELIITLGLLLIMGLAEDREKDGD